MATDKSPPSNPVSVSSAQTAPATIVTLPRTFVGSLAWAIPIHMLVALVVVAGAALFYTQSRSGEGLWSQVGGWSLTALYSLLALLGGAITGLLYSAATTVERLEQALRGWLHTLPAISASDGSPGQPLQTVRDQYGAILDKWLGRILDKIWLPRWLDTLIRSSVRETIVDRFVTSCEQRGVHLVGPQEFRNWLLAEGVGLGFLPLHNQLFWWRYLILSFLGTLALLAALLSYFST